MSVHLRLEDISHLPQPGTDVPAAIRFAPGGEALTYLQSTDGSLVRSLWWHDLRSGERRVIAGPIPGTEREDAIGHEERLRRERTRTSELGVTEFAWAAYAAKPTLAVPVGGRVLAGTGPDARAAVDGLAPLEGVEAVSCAVLAPDGLRVAFVRDGDLWVTDLEGAVPLRLTHDAEPGVFNGLAEFIAAEELGRYEGLWWSLDGSHIAFAHVDERGVPPFVITHVGSDPPTHEEHRYPFAGGPNAQVTLRVIASTGGPSTAVELGMAPDDYLARVVAEPSGGWLVAVLPRAQRSLRWLRVTQDGEASELWTETSEPWLNLDVHTRVLTNGDILRTTERTGYRHLELRQPDGTFARQLTAGEWVVTDVDHVDEARREVLFVGTAEGATERHLYAVSLDASQPESSPQRLTDEAGWHEVSVSIDGVRWTDTCSTLEHAPSVTVRHRDDRAPFAIHDATLTAASLGRRPPELLTLVAADGSTPLDATIYRPESPAGSPPPCVVWVYGGPHAQFVKRAWEATLSPLRQYLAQTGVAVVVGDHRGSANRGLGFEAPLARHFGGVEVADQAAAMRQLAEMGEIDISRVAITGGSYGGKMTLRCVIAEPSIFRAGVAVAPVTDQAGYDTAYAERYLGRPQDDPAAYERSSILPQAADLSGSVLLIHGALDENVHLRHSIRLVAALQALDRDIELVILPEDRHRVRTAAGLRTRDRRTVAHLLTELGVPLPDEVAAGGTEATARV
ncbi:MAG TPA: DPP IV N-terminal domain-containing protein [Candidatus Limnocylindria bacterium]|nr:DPP IV N-terminal domain-containing protein [Candidatus Limnocylindria bacterium]